MNNRRVSVSAALFLWTTAAVSSAQDLPELPKPQKEHEWLQRFVGEWTSQAEGTMGPDQPQMKCEGTQRARMLGGFWMIAEGNGNAMGTQVHSVLTLGYDPAQAKYIGTWTDSCSNHMWRYEGAVSEDGSTLTLNTAGPSIASPEKTSNYREVIEFQGDDHYVFSSMIETGKDEWFTFMTAHFQREQFSSAE